MAVNKDSWETYLKTFLCGSRVLMTAEAYGGAGLVSADAPGRASARGRGGGEAGSGKGHEGCARVKQMSVIGVSIGNIFHLIRSSVQSPG